VIGSINLLELASGVTDPCARSLLQSSDLSFLPLNHLLAEVRPLGQLFLHVFVDLNLASERFNLFEQLVIPCDNYFSLL